MIHLVHFNHINQNWLRLKQLFPIEHFHATSFSRHVGGQKQYIFSCLGNKIYFYAKLFHCFGPPTWPPWKPSIEHNLSCCCCCCCCCFSVWGNKGATGEQCCALCGQLQQWHQRSCISRVSFYFKTTTRRLNDTNICDIEEYERCLNNWSNFGKHF